MWQNTKKYARTAGPRGTLQCVYIDLRYWCVRLICPHALLAYVAIGLSPRRSLLTVSIVFVILTLTRFL